MADILVLSSDKSRSEALDKALGSAGRIVFVAPPEAAPSFKQCKIDLIVIDVGHGMASRDVESILKSARGSRQIPAVALIREGQAEEFGEAVDDVVFDPYRDSELNARVGRLLRKSGAGSEDVIRCAELVIDTQNYDVVLGGEKLDLTFKEYQLLVFLATNPGKVVTREVILNKVWGYDYFGSDRTVDVHVRRLRSKIETGDTCFIETVRNVGYRFKRVG